MAITKQAREQLGATIVGHEGLGQTVKTASGMIKTSRGLIAPSSTSKEDTRSGALFEDDEEPSVQDPSPVMAAVTPVPQVKTGIKKTRRGIAKTEYVVAEVTVEGFGSLPTQYSHVYVGNGVLVLGLNDLSYKPEPAEQTEDGELTHVIKLDKAPGRRYIFCGNSFTDDKGIVNLLLIEIQGE